MKKQKARLLTVAQVAEQVGAAERSVRLWASQGKFQGAELVHPPAGVSYWLIPETALKGFEKRGRGRPPKAESQRNASKKGPSK